MAWSATVLVQAILTYLVIGYFSVLLLNQILGFRLLPHQNSTLFLGSILSVIFLEWMLVRFSPEMNTEVHRFINQYTPLLVLIPLSILLLLWSYYFGLYTPLFYIISLVGITFLIFSVIQDYFHYQSNSLTA